MAKTNSQIVTCSKHIGNKTLWEYEQLMVVVNLPTEHNWFMIPLFAPQELMNNFRHDQSPKHRNEIACGVFT